MFTGLENLDLRRSASTVFCCCFPKPRVLSSQVQPRVQK